MQFFAYTPYSLGVYSTPPPPPLNMISILVCIYIYSVHMYMNLQMMTILASDMTIWEHLSHEDEYINERGIRHYCTYMQYYNTTLNNKKDHNKDDKQNKI